MNSLSDRPAPGLRRRLACLVYESLLVFAVLMAAGIVYAVATRQTHALKGSAGLSLVVFLVLGLYFVWFWMHGGQTVAMKAWRIRVEDATGAPLRAWRAIARYVLAWMWFAPGLAVAAVVGLGHLGGAGLALVLTANVLGYAALAWLHPRRQFWHDALCGSRLVDTKPAESGP